MSFAITKYRGPLCRSPSHITVNGTVKPKNWIFSTGTALYVLRRQNPNIYMLYAFAAVIVKYIARRPKSVVDGVYNLKSTIDR